MICGWTITAATSRRAGLEVGRPGHGGQPGGLQVAWVETVACRLSTSISASRSGRSILIFIRNR